MSSVFPVSCSPLTLEDKRKEREMAPFDRTACVAEETHRIESNRRKPNERLMSVYQTRVEKGWGKDLKQRRPLEQRAIG